MTRVNVDDFSVKGWADPQRATERSQHYCRQLEEGNILYFAQLPFDLSPEDRTFLLSVKQSDASYHKNIAYRPKQDRVTGFDRGSAEYERLRDVMRRYSQRIIQFASSFLPRYAATWKLDYASYRPVQEKGRQLSLKARNDLLHVDAFPTRPTNGNRILRVFTNVNPSEPRIWVTTDPFDAVAKQLAVPAGLKTMAAQAHRPPPRLVRAVVRRLGYRQIDRSPYDRFMLHFHDYMKADEKFQKDCPKYRWEFPPYTMWMCFLDMVPHAVQGGQYALEQTFFVERSALLQPEKAPVAVLEQLSGVKLTY